MRKPNKDRLRKFVDASYMERSDLRDTGRKAPLPVGAVVTVFDRTGYHDEQVVIAHPTVIDAVGHGYSVGVALNYPTGEAVYRLLDEDDIDPNYQVDNKTYWRPGTEEVVRKVVRTYKNPSKPPTRAANPGSKLKRSLMR